MPLRSATLVFVAILIVVPLGLLRLVGWQSVAAAESADDLLAAGQRALAAGRLDEAFAAAERAVQQLRNDPRPLLLRAQVNEARRESSQACDDCDALLAPAMLPKLTAPVDVYELRGRVRFFLADAAGSSADFDRAVDLAPRRGPGHWQRGISYYYAERFNDGQQQFEGYQTVDNADVENAVWRYLCMARSANVEQARQELLKIGDDRRVPMRHIYEMFAGRLTPDDVLAAAEAGEASPAERRSRRFYAQLYVGLYLEVAGEPRRSLEHVRRAAEEFPIGHYMADVARTHVKLRGQHQQVAP